MIIDDFNIYRPQGSLRPLETNPPLVIDPDAVLALAVALERFETVSWQVQIEQRCRRIELVELHLRLALKASESLAPVSIGELSRLFVSEDTKDSW